MYVSGPCTWIVNVHGSETYKFSMKYWYVNQNVNCSSQEIYLLYCIYLNLFRNIQIYNERMKLLMSINETHAYFKCLSVSVCLCLSPSVCLYLALSVCVRLCGSLSGSVGLWRARPGSVWFCPTLSAIVWLIGFLIDRRTPLLRIHSTLLIHCNPIANPKDTNATSPNWRHCIIKGTQACTDPMVSSWK